MSSFTYSPLKIYSMLETGVGTVQEPDIILTPKGQEIIGCVTSWEWGENITVICPMNAAGRFIHLVFICPCQRMSLTLGKGGPLVLCTSAQKITGQMRICSCFGFIISLIM
jgi:hypothetical protein